MLERQYSEKIFIDRPFYTNQFREFLSKNQQGIENEWIYYQYDATEDENEQGGIGKTFLLSEYINIIEKEFSDNFQVVNPIIDFIEIQNRTQITMWTTLALKMTHFPGANFVKFHQFLTAFFNVNDIEFLRFAIEEFCQVCKTISKKLNKKLVFFFDTFELIQEHVERLERVTHFPSDSLQNATVTIFSSRQKPNLKSENWKTRHDKIKLVPVSGFTDDEAIIFFERNKIELDGQIAKVVNREYVKKLNAPGAANGRPILLALAIDYLKNDVVDSKQIVQPTQNFQEEFIDHLNKFRSPLDSVIRIMAHVYHPWDIEMLKNFEGFWLSKIKSKITIENIFEHLKKLSFIRTAGENSIILHDEMRELIIEYVWEKNDKNYEERQEISKKAISFYKELANKKKCELTELKNDTPQYIRTRQEYRMFVAEIWYHKLFSDFNQYFSDFLTNELTLALEKGDLEQAELYMEILTELNKQRPLLETDWNRIELRQLRIYLGRYYLDEAEKFGLQLLKKLKTQLHEVKDGKKLSVSEYGQKLEPTEKKISKAIGNVAHYLAQVYFRMANHKNAENYFKEAHYFYEMALNNEPLNFHTEFLFGRNLNWQGYILMDRGLFYQSVDYYEQAEQKLKYALSELYHHRKDFMSNPAIQNFISSTEKEIKQWIAYINGNRSRAFLNLGDYIKAENYGFVALQMRRNLDLPVEVARSLNSLGLVYQKKKEFERALERFYEAQQILMETHEPILLGRILTNIGSTLMCRDAFSEIFFFSSVDSLDKSIERVEKNLRPDPENSIIKLQEAIQVLQSIGKPTSDLANVLFNTGEYYLYHKKWQQAMNYFSQARDTALKVHNFYYYYDVLQRLLAIHYYSNLDAILFENTLTEIEEKSIIKGYTPIKDYPGLLMRVLLLKSNFLIDAYLKDHEFPLFKIQKNEALEKAFHGYYDTAKLIYTISPSQYNKVIELISVHQKKRLPVSDYSAIAQKIIMWLEDEKENSDFVNDFRIYFQSIIID